MPTYPMLEYLWIVPLLPLLGAAVNGLFGTKWPNKIVNSVAIGSTGLSFLAAIEAVREFFESGQVFFHKEFFTWIAAGNFRAGFDLQMDQLTVVMVLVVTGVGSLIHIYAAGYMSHEGGYYRFFSYLNLFMFFMLVLVLSANYVLLFVGWEGVGLCSYLLVGFYFLRKSATNAGMKAFIVNRIGDFGFSLAMFLIVINFGSLDFDKVLPAAAGKPETALTYIGLLLLLGAAGKSAQFPLYVWLPDAMQGPTPVSALIHAATMVTAGVYLVARCGALFALAPVGSATVAGVGALTALFAATIALKQWDIKRVLAYSTISQLGYMFLGVGTGAISAGIFHLITHAFFKALLFLGSGSVIFAMQRAYHHTHAHEDAQDMRNMGGLARFMPWTAGLMWIATLAIAGVPPLAGFFSKDEILTAAFARGGAQPVWLVFWALALVAALLTAFYMTRLMLYTFHGPNRTGEKERAHLHEAPWIMTGPLVVLGAGSVLTGLLNLPEMLPGSGWLERWLDPVTETGAAYIPEATLSTGAEWALLVFATLVAAAGIAAAWRLLHPERLVPAREAVPESGIAKVLYRKYYVDEIY